MSTATVVGCSASTVGIDQRLGLSVSEQIGSRLRQPRGHAQTLPPALALAPVMIALTRRGAEVFIAPRSCSGDLHGRGDRHPRSPQPADRPPSHAAAGDSESRNQRTATFSPAIKHDHRPPGKGLAAILTTKSRGT